MNHFPLPSVYWFFLHIVSGQLLPPAGYAFVVDDDGSYVVDDFGAFLIAEI